MIRINVFGNNQAVKNYYEASLASGDYYLKDGKGSNQEMVGNWGGKLAEEMGLSGAVTKEDFFKLSENINPKTGEQLTQKNKKNRRVGYDFNFHVPKSFSIMQGIAGDDRLTGVFREAVNETMQDMEGSMLTRVRKDGEMDDRKTGNMAWAEFVHFTARPVGGVPDPHLHAHCFVFNATHDKEEDKTKAGQFVDIKRNADLFQAGFHARLMSKVKDLGYNVRLNQNMKGWEIEGVPQSAIDKFSRRTKQIEKQAFDLGISNDDKQKEKLGSTTRENKQKDLSMDELGKVWTDGLTNEELGMVTNQKEQAERESQKLRNKIKIKSPFSRASEFVDLALADELERDSVATKKDILKKGLMFGQGEVNQSQIEAELKRREAMGGLIRYDQAPNQTFYTTKKLIGEEKDILGMINRGKNKYAPIKYKAEDLDKELLSDEQKKAIKHLLDSRDSVTSIRGGAGTGKTTTLGLAVKYFDQAGKKVFAFAPSSQASRGVLREDGFEGADTVAKFLQSPNIQKQTQGEVILIDEAGLLSVPELKQVLDTARKNKARVILSGDTRQHSSVQRGDALRLAEGKSKLARSELNQTRRQLDEEYKKAVENIRDGLTKEGLDRLDNIGAIKEIESPQDKYRELAKDYADITESQDTALVVTPTHREGLQVNDQIREELKSRGLLGKDKGYYQIMKNQNLTEAQRRPEFLKEGDIVRFHKDFEGIEKGKKYYIHPSRSLDGKIKKYLTREGEDVFVPLWDGAEKHYNLYKPDYIPISQNEKIQITQNSFDQDNKPLLNGQNLKVLGFGENGEIIAQGKGRVFTLPRNFEDFKHGYYSTSHGSQGKTADYVLLAQGSDSLPASSQKQLYVSTSRGRRGIRIYTDNKDELKENTADEKSKVSALELIQKKRYQEEKARKDKEIENQRYRKEEIRDIKEAWQEQDDKKAKIKDTLQDKKPKTKQPKEFNPFSRYKQNLTNNQPEVSQTQTKDNQAKPQTSWADISKKMNMPIQTQEELNQDKEKSKEREK